MRIFHFIITEQMRTKNVVLLQNEVNTHIRCNNGLELFFERGLPFDHVSLPRISVSVVIISQITVTCKQMNTKLKTLLERKKEACV